MRTFSWLILASVLCATTAGCRLWKEDSFEFVPVAISKHPLEQEIRAAQWRKNPAWSTDTFSPNGGPPYRWELVAAKPQENATESDKPAADEAVDAPHPQAPEPEGQEPLEARLAKLELGPFDERFPLHDLVLNNDVPAVVDWNATILLMRRDAGLPNTTADEPDSLAVCFQPILEELVVNPPRFDSSSGERIGVLKAARENLKPGSKEEAPKENIRELPVETRAAAAEAWCQILVQAADNPIDGLAPAGRALERDDLPLEVRCELMRSVARWVPPADIPGLAAALDSSLETQASPEIRRAALEACMIHARTLRVEKKALAFDAAAWPATVMSCQYDADPKMRQAFGRWIAASQHPQACATLKALMLDTSLPVREDALFSLGRLGTDEARKELERQAQRSEPRVRAFAVRGLAQYGAPAVARFATDEAPEVRRAVAEQLAGHPAVESALLLRNLLADPSPQVQEQVVASIRTWPKELAVPLLLSGIRESARPARQKCSVALRERTGILDAIPVEATHEERARFVSDLARTHHLPSDFLDDVRTAGITPQPPRESPRAAELRGWLEDVATLPAEDPHYVAALERLRQVTAADLSTLEDYFAKAPASPATELLDKEILPRLNPLRAALAQMGDGDVNVRRNAARTIADAAARASLPAVLVVRLRERLIHEQDQLVWRYAMSAVGNDANDEAAQIALVAINHAWPDIRLIGCEYVARHQRPQHAAWLVPLFSDRNKEVRLAAAEAAGCCHSASVLDDLPRAEGETPLRGLRSLLTDADPRIRQAAAVSMSRLGDVQGMDELKRLSMNDDPMLRVRVAGEMARTGQTRFVEHLIRAGWTETDDRVKRAILQCLETLTPSENRPQGLADQPSVDAKIRLWAAWWDLQRAAPTAAAPAISPATPPPL